MVEAVLLSSIPRLRLISTVPQLAMLLGLSYGRLAFALHRMNAARKYRTFSIRKKSGSDRIIDAPNSFILGLQRQLLPLLEEIYTPPPPVFGHVKDRSIIGNAEMHVGRRYIANFDIRNFYHAIHFRRIVGILTSSRYGLARPVATAIAQLACHNGRLPMGGATSGIISNIVCGPLDSRLIRLAKRHNLRYSRYVDDLTFSATNPEGLRTAMGVEMYGRYIVKDTSLLSEEFIANFTEEGFELNPNKMWIVARQARQQVNSLVINKKINVRREYVRSLRGAIHAMERHGLAAAQEVYASQHRGVGAELLVNNVAGRLAFYGAVTGYGEPYNRLAIRFLNLGTGARLPTPLTDRERAIYQLTTEAGDEGTAFYIGDGVFVTAAHVVENVELGAAVWLRAPGHFDGRLAATLAASDLGLDVAVLHGSRTLARPRLAFAGATTSRGAEVCAYGFPQFNEGNTCAHIPALVTATRDLGGVSRVEVDTPWPHGTSGGPVITADGRIAGIVYSGPPLGEATSPFGTCFTPFAAIRDYVATHSHPDI